MDVSLKFGPGYLPVHVPDGVRTTVLRMSSVPAQTPRQEVVAQALQTPLGSPRLEELARGMRSACVVVCDITRPCPNDCILPPVLAAIERGGVPRDAITVLIATGLHRANEGDELTAIVGCEVAENYRVVNHHARERREHVVIGAYQGAEIAVDKRYVEADLHVLIGLVEPHFMAGYSGGRKLVCPGIASQDTIRLFHRPELVGHPRSRAGVLNGNPIHAMALAAARMAGVDFTVNVTLDEGRRLTGVFAGELETAHQAGIQRVDEQSRKRLPAPADIVVTSSAGSPLDATFYQSTKGLIGAAPAVKEGGEILLAAAMDEGVGSPEFAALFREYPTPDEFMAALKEPGFFSIDQWQVQALVGVLRHARVSVHGRGVDVETLESCYVHPVDNLDAALQEALARQGASAHVVVIPEGPYILPTVN